MSTCLLSGTFLDPSETAIVGATVRFTIDNPCFDASASKIISPKEITTTTASDGTWSLTLSQGASGTLTLDCPPDSVNSARRYTFAVNIPLTSSATFASAWADPTNAASFTPPLSFSQVSGTLQTSQLPALPSADVWVGNGSNAATAVGISGDATISNAGVLTVSNSAITNAKVSASAAIAYNKLSLTGSIVNADMANMASSSTTVGTIKGNISGSAAAPSDIILTSANTASSAVYRDGSGNFSAGTVTAALTGTASGNLTYSANNHGVVVSGSGNTATVIAPDSSTTKVLVSGGSSADPAWGTVAATAGGTGQTTWTTGDVPYASATNTVSKLGIGSSGQFLKVSAGIPSWGPGASGINYVSSNPDAEADTSGWGTYADAAGAQPVDGTGGSPTTTWTRSTSSPLRGTGSFLLTKDAANRQGEGADFAITLDSADQAKPLMVSFDYAVASGTYADGDLTVYLYDVTNSLVIQPAPYKILSAAIGLSQKWIGYFQTSAASTSYRLLIHVASTSASAYTVKFDNWQVGPTYQSYGAVQTDWTAFTPTGSWVSNTTYTGFYRRRGDSIDLQYNLALAGAPTSATLTLNLPSGVTLDTNKMTSQAANTFFGLVKGSGAGNSFLGAVQYNSTTSLLPIYIKDGSTASIMAAGAITQAAPYTFANADFVTITAFDVPVAGWSSNVQVSSDADTRVCAFRGTNTAGTTLTKSANNTVPFATTDYDTHGAWNGSNTFTCPLPGKYTVKAALCIAAGATWAAQDYIECDVWKNGAAHTVQALIIYAADTSTVMPTLVAATVNCVAGDTITINCFPSKASAGNVTLNTSTGLNSICIERLSGPAQIAASEKVYLQYTGNAGTVLTANVTNMDFSTKVVDSHGAWSGTTFTAPKASWYDIKGGTRTSAATTLSVQIYKNGSSNIFMSQDLSDALRIFGGGIYLNAGDTLTIRSDTNATLNNSSSQHWISITSQGGF